MIYFAFVYCEQFLVMIVLRHTLPIVMDGAGEYSFTLYTVSYLQLALRCIHGNLVISFNVLSCLHHLQLLMLRTIGIVLPMFVMLKACSIIRNHRRHRQVSEGFKISIELPFFIWGRLKNPYMQEGNE